MLAHALRLAAISLLLAGLSLLLAVPPAPAAMFSDVVRVHGAADGITTVRYRDALALRFAPRAAPIYRLIADRKVQVECQAVISDARGDFYPEEGFGFPARFPRRRSTLPVAKPGYDVCAFSIPRGGRATTCVTPTNLEEDECLRLVVPLSVVGQVYVARFLRALDLARAYELVGEAAKGERWPALQQLPRTIRSRLAALEAPDATPPAGRVGYWTDGRQVAFSVLDFSGRRLFLSETGPEGELVFSTNVSALSGPSEPSLL